MVQTLYKKTSLGAIQTWKCTRDENTFFTEEGILNGKITKSKPTICYEKNIGKKNHISAIKQAEKEVLAKYVLKLKSGYYKTIEECSKDKSFTPMLAFKYEDKLDKIVFPVGSENKLDGIRCYITSQGMFSRKDNAIICAPHIWDSIKVLYKSGDPAMIFDGELYNHKLKDDFNKIVSLSKKSTNLTKERLDECKKYIEFHCYDYYNKNHPNLTSLERAEYIQDVLKGLDYIKVVEMTICNDQKDLDKAYKLAKKQGYEGQIIRGLDAKYECKRTNSLLKRKDFIDEEFLITAILEGKGDRSGMMGKIVCVTEAGIEFEADGSGIGGHEFYKELLKNKDKYIGKLATVVFQNYTPAGSIRFGRVKAIRDDYE